VGSVNVALVTGGAKGIGLAIVRRLAQDGWRVVAAGRDRQALDAVVDDITAEGYEVTAVQCDVTDDQSVADLIAACDRVYGCPDLLVNNAGIAGATVATTDLELSDWNQVLAVNLTGAMLCCRAVLPGMLDRGSGHIVNISSITGKRPLTYRVAYAASKLGLIGLTRSLAEEVGPAGVRVNAISPGPVYGERIERVLEGQAAARKVPIEQARADFTSSAPLRRFVEPAEVAEAVVALHGLSAVTGVDLNVAAGLVMY
jgi:NAD(P)-dependent dehydrogenase (short-subunit alcohol dehydrogenase family)